VPLLEAFGNARTINNVNSSRFGKFLKLVYTADGAVQVRARARARPRVVLLCGTCAPPPHPRPPRPPEPKYVLITMFRLVRCGDQCSVCTCMVCVCVCLCMCVYLPPGCGDDHVPAGEVARGEAVHGGA
jgi:hypothetical protein